MIKQPRLLITRFSPHAEVLSEEFNKIGFFSIAQPLLKIMPLEDNSTVAKLLSGYYEIVIAVSSNAVECTQKMINQSWPIANYLAVGSLTQSFLSKVVKQNVLVPSIRFDSEGLLDLEVLHSIKNKNILILRGEGGRDLLDKTLVERGACVDFLQSYKRIQLDLNWLELVNNWQQALINGVIISSIEILNQLFTIVPSKHRDWLLKLVFYVPSMRIAKQASSLGVVNIVLLPSLQTEKVIKFFKVNNENSR